MKRVSTELEAMSEPEKEPNREFLLLQGVRFAFRVHQVMPVCSFLPLFFYIQYALRFKETNHTSVLSENCCTSQLMNHLLKAHIRNNFIIPKC